MTGERKRLRRQRRRRTGARAWTLAAAGMVAATVGAWLAAAATRELEGLGAAAHPDAVVACAVPLGGAVVAGWYALTAAAGLLARCGLATHALHRILARHGAPALRRLAASTALAGLGVGVLSVGASASEIPADLGWGATPSVDAGPNAPPTPRLQEATAATATTTAPDHERPGTEYVVQRGDSLWSIAAQHLPGGAGDAETADAWPRWYAANRDVIGPDPNLIHPGQVLLAPNEEDPA